MANLETENLPYTEVVINLLKESIAEKNLIKARMRSTRLVTLIGANPGCSAAELAELGYCGRWYCGLLPMEDAGVVVHHNGGWYLNQTEVYGQGYFNLTNNEAKRLGGEE